MFPVNLLGMIKLIKMASLIIISWSGSRMDLTTTKVVVLLLLGLTKIVFGLAPLVLTRFFLKNGLRIKKLNRALSVFTKWKISSWIFMQKV